MFYSLYTVYRFEQTPLLPVSDTVSLFLNEYNSDFVFDPHADFSFSVFTAHNYPIATLSRTMNPYTKEVLNYVSFTLSVVWSRMLVLKSYKSSIFSEHDE